MTPEAGRFLAKAQKLLVEAETILRVGLYDAAGRSAYLAGFHAAPALIAERVGRALKTHSGVQSEFLRLTKDDARLESSQRVFLSRGYNLKTIADYETDPDSGVSHERAAEAIEAAKHFVTRIGILLE